jgi:hypothetical protein
MTQPAPTALEDWRTELGDAFAAARAELAASDEDPGDELWHRMEDQAVSRARAARGLPELDGDPESVDRTINAITDLTEQLRKHGGGDPEDHHISESQFFLLYYLAAQVHAGVVPIAAAGEVVKACWGGSDGDEADAVEDEDGDDDDDEPWEVVRAAPLDDQGWMTEVLGAWREAARPPPLRTAEGKPVLAASNDLREAGVILALHRRGCVPPAEAVYGLIGVIAEMEADIAGLGPELARLKRSPPMAFVLYYVWTHILIGHADEGTAMAVVQEASGRIAEFSTSGSGQNRGTARFRRPN